MTPDPRKDDGLAPVTANMQSLRHGHDVFRDDDDALSGKQPGNQFVQWLIIPGIYGDRVFTTPSRHDQRYEKGVVSSMNLFLPHARPDVRNRFGLYPFARISQSPLISPTPSSRDVSSRLFSGRNAQRPRVQGSVFDNYGVHANFGKTFHPLFS